MELPSKGAINRAGFVIRRARLGEAQPDDDLEAAWATVRLFVRAHSGAWDVVFRTLFLIVQQEVPESMAAVSRRLKSDARIEHKVSRAAKVRLATVRDIAGCRATVLAPHEPMNHLAAIRRRLHHWLEITKDIDYIKSPRGTGYRAIHLIARVHSRNVEIQLRTRRQSEWAQLNERLEDRFGWSLKEEQGPADVTAELRELSDALHEADLGRTNAGHILTLRNRLLDRLG